MAEWEEIKNILLGLLVVGVVLLIISPGLRHAATSIFSVADKYGAPKLTLTNNYMFTAERVDIPGSFDNDCTITKWGDTGHNFGSEFSCKKDKPTTFNIIILNGGSQMRTFHGGTVICKLGDKDCCGNSNTLSSYGVDDYSITPGSRQGAKAGAYTFDGKYTDYEVHPVAECIKDPTYGCYTAGMTTTVKSCNPSKYIIVHVID